MRLSWIYIFKRLLATIPIILAVSFLVFGACALIPGTEADLVSARGVLSEEDIKAIEKELKLDQAFLIRYGSYLFQAVRYGDLGRSFKSDERVAEALIQRTPATLELTAAAMAMALVVGMLIGMIAALKAFTFLDYGSMFLALAGLSIPVFWLAMMLQIQFEATTGRIGSAFFIDESTGLYLIDTLFSDQPGAFWSALRHLILPALALSTIPLAVIARMTRAAMLEVLAQDYVRTAWAKGLPGRVVVIKHALRNALIPVVTIAGLQFASLLGGAVLTESVFAWPGLGTYIYQAASNQDTQALQGGVIYLAVVFTVINLAVDVSYSLIDPRIRVGDDND